MRRFLSLWVAVSLIGAGAAMAVGVSPRASLRHFTCQRALDPKERAVSVTTVMRPVKGTVKMALRFELLSQAEGSTTPSQVKGGDLNSWISPPNPTLGQLAGDVWILKKQVVDLVAPAGYRFRVLFRWSGAHHRRLAATARDSQTCFEPELRPDLTVESISVNQDPTTPEVSTYVATVQNQGLTAAGRFKVAYSPGDGGKVRTRSVPRLAAGSSTQVTFTGPSCSSSVMPTITADPNDQVDDANRSNNSKAVVCPAEASRALKRSPTGR